MYIPYYGFTGVALPLRRQSYSLCTSQRLWCSASFLAACLLQNEDSGHTIMSQPAQAVTWQTWHGSLSQSWLSCPAPDLLQEHQHLQAVEETAPIDKLASSQHTAHAITYELQDFQRQLQMHLPLPCIQQCPGLRVHLALIHGPLAHPVLATSRDILASLASWCPCYVVLLAIMSLGPRAWQAGPEGS